MQQNHLPLIRHRLGFSDGGALSSRTAMQEEIVTLLALLPSDADAVHYRQEILEHNILNKATASNRLKTFTFLRRLYALDPQVCLFREMRRLYRCAVDDVPLLIGLLAMAREPILRECLTMVLGIPVGESLGRAAFEAWIRKHAPGKYSEAMYISFSHNLYSSFHQFGYIGKSIGKTRYRIPPKTGIASATYAAFIDWLEGRNGIVLLQGPYSQALDLSADRHIELLQTGSSQGLLKVAYAGGVLEFGFPGFLKNTESRLVQ